MSPPPRSRFIWNRNQNLTQTTTGTGIIVSGIDILHSTVNGYSIGAEVEEYWTNNQLMC